jgi:hypothetical protein
VPTKIVEMLLEQNQMIRMNRAVGGSMISWLKLGYLAALTESVA